MLLVDAVIAIAQRDCPDEWQRYCEVAPRVLGDTVPRADAPRELLRQGGLSRYFLGRVGGGRDQAAAAETVALERKFREQFVTALHAGKYSLYAVRAGHLKATKVPPVLITAETLRLLPGKDDQMELAGRQLFGLHVQMAGQEGAELPRATDAQIHAAIDAVCEAAKAAGENFFNVKTIGKPVVARLRALELAASENQVGKLFGESRHAGQRGKSGVTLANRKRD